MSRKMKLVSAVGALLMSATLQTRAVAAPASIAQHGATQGATISAENPHASLRLDVAHGKAWVGQALPFTLRAYFRDVDGVTLDGAPQLTSPGIYTSEIATEPRQSTEVIGGAPVLVATWTGSLTPSSPGPLEIAASLPVRVRYREAAPAESAPDPFGADPFGALGAFGSNPFDMSAFQHFFEQSLGRVRETSVALRASARRIDVSPLPSAGRPATFAGAVGRFDLAASVSSAHTKVSEPVKLDVVVDGDGDLARVDVPGIATSEAWKAYPPKVTTIAAVPGKHAARKVFEQVIVPLQGGELTVPPVSLTSFDPSSGRYITRETLPLRVSVDGTAAASPDVAPPASSTTTAAPASVNDAPRSFLPLALLRAIRPATVLLAITPVLILLILTALFVRARATHTERALRRAMKRAASAGDAARFYRAARAFIEARLADRWAMRAEEIGPRVIRDRMGVDGDALLDALAADEALRFGRAALERPDLVAVCRSIDRTLGAVPRRSSSTDAAEAHSARRAARYDGSR